MDLINSEFVKNIYITYNINMVFKVKITVILEVVNNERTQIWHGIYKQSC